MKRICCFFIFFLLFLGLPACAGRSASEPPQTTEPPLIVTIDLQPQPTDTPIPTEAPTPAPTDTPKPYVAQNRIYTIAWISDPQHYSKKFPETYYAMTAFLRDHREELNLQYIIHTGDLVHNADEEAQWEVADRAQTMIDEIPNGVLAGNHDLPEDVGYAAFTKRFGEARYASRPWYGGSYKNNRGHYDLITAGETDYLFVYMGYEPDEAAFDWVREVFSSFPDRVGILCLHDYYTKTLELSKDGKKWYDRVVKKTPNLYMVLCGHKYGAYCFPEIFDDDGDGKPDRTVYQMLFNYQACAIGDVGDGGGGFLRLMQIDEASGTLHNLTYSPVWDAFNRFKDEAMRCKYYEFDESHEEFVLTLPWRITYAAD